ncbi:acyltransferase family protein [Litorimonas sp. WD9-15]|uniref:acyltransferase family protein n=1 Tax=Litorimonas sp. WD9-15 TaxID=3418716 RepID=UPI003D01476F
MSGPAEIKPQSGQPEYYAALDGFRGLLAVFVAVYHTIWLSHPQRWAFFENGPVIIDLFFALSGFLMWRLYSKKLQGPAGALQFMKRRFARLYPLHVFMLAVFVGFAILRLVAHKIGIAETTPGEILPFETGSIENWGSLLQHLTLTHAFGFEEALTFNPPSWTIGAEFWTYLVFVGVVLWCRPSKFWHFVIMALLVSLIYFALSRVRPNLNITYDLGFWRCLAGFFSGVLAAASFAYLRPYLRKLSVKGFTALEITMVLLGTAFVIYCGGKLQFLVGPIIFSFILLFAFDGGLISRFMSRPIFLYLAKISYSVYMTHVIIAFAFGIVLKRGLGELPTGWAGDFWLGIYLCVVLVVSHLTWRFVEKPGGRWLRALQLPQKRVAKTEPSV